MRLVTPRLEIRTPETGEGAKLADYYRQNQSFLQPFYPTFTREDFDPRAWESTLPHLRNEVEMRRALRVCLFQGNRISGVINVTNVNMAPRFSATVGYSLAEEAQGQGLMKEALEAIIPVVLQRFRVHRLEANYMPRNERSGRTLASVGFQQEGLAKSYLLINGNWEDHILTALVNPDWK